MSELPGGWRLDDLAAMARHVVRTQQGLILDREEAADIAAVAIIARLYEDPAPDRTSLFRAARAALAAANGAEYSFAGLDANADRKGHGDYTRTPPGWATYWNGGRRLREASFEECIIEQIAVRQIMAALPERHREALTVLAEQENYTACAELLGLTAKAWDHRITKARKEARRLWSWPEPPGRYWGRTWHGHVSTDTHGRSGISVRLGNMRAKRRKETAA